MSARLMRVYNGLLFNICCNVLVFMGNGYPRLCNVSLQWPCLCKLMGIDLATSHHPGVSNKVIRSHYTFSFSVLKGSLTLSSTQTFKVWKQQDTVLMLTIFFLLMTRSSSLKLRKMRQGLSKICFVNILSYVVRLSIIENHLSWLAPTPR